MVLPSPAPRSAALALALALALAGPHASASQASGASAPVAAPEAGTVDQRLDELTEQGRARPEQVAAALGDLLAGLAADAPQRVRALELLGWLQATMNDADASERTAVQLDAIAQQAAAQSARALAAADLVRAKLLVATGPMVRAERLAVEALSRLPEATPPSQRLPYLMLVADVKERTGKLDESVKVNLQALTLADASLSKARSSQVRSTLAYTLYEVGQKERALKLNREAMDLGREAGDEYALNQASTTQAILLSQSKDDKGELDALQAAIDHAVKAGAKREEILSLANLADFYLKRGQYAIALQQSQRALPLTREVRSRSAESLALTNLGLALISLHRKAEGMEAVQQGLAIEERSGSITTMADTWSELGIYLEKAGELKDALEADRQHRRLADEVFRQEQQQTILEMQESFDNDRRNRELELLNRQNRLNEEQILQRELQQRLWGMAAALCVLALGVIVLLVQRGRRANKLLARTNEQLKVQSERDPLTGLANRRHFQHAMRRLATDERLTGTVFLLDIDHFKQINDTHGHAAGDAVLVEIARRLRSTLRDEDLVVRWGGEEFLVVVQSLSPDQVDALAQRLLGAIACEPVAGPEAQVPVSASIGFATFPLEPAGISLTWERAIELVDTTMYLAKAHGRNRAYGVRLLHAADEAEVGRMAKTLEQAWREDRVALTLLQGPTPGGGA